MKKKIVSMLLTACMLLSMIPAVVFTASAEDGKIILIASNGTVTYDGGSAGTYSGSNYYAINKAGNYGETVYAIVTAAGVARAGISIGNTGVRGIDNGESTFVITSMPGGIDIANNGWIGAINQQSSTNTSGTSNLTVKGVGDVKVKATGGTYGAKGIGIYSAKNTDISQNVVDIAMKSLTVESVGGDAYAIQGSLAGRTTTVNVTEAVAVTGAGKAYGTNFTSAAPKGKATLNFGSLSSTSTGGSVYGLHSAGGVDADVTLDGDMTVNGASGATGLRLAGIGDWTLNGKGGKAINLVLNGSYVTLADLGGNKSTAKLNLNVNEITATASTEDAIGFYLRNSGTEVKGSVKTLSVTGKTDATAIANNGGAVVLQVTDLSASGETGSNAINATGGTIILTPIGTTVAQTITGDVILSGTGTTTDITGLATAYTVINGSISVGAGSVLNLKNATANGDSFSNAGTVNVDLADADGANIKLFDYTGSGSMTLDDYGTVNLLNSSNYILGVVDNDLYAIYVGTITYMVEGVATVITGAPTYYVPGTGLTAAELSAVVPTAPANKYFAGWYDQAEGGVKQTSISKDVSTDVVLYAQFKDLLDITLNTTKIGGYTSADGYTNKTLIVAFGATFEDYSTYTAEKYGFYIYNTNKDLDAAKKADCSVELSDDLVTAEGRFFATVTGAPLGVPYYAKAYVVIDGQYYFSSLMYRCSDDTVWLEIA